MTVGRSRLYPCSSGPPAPRNGSKPLRKAKSAPRSGERIPRHPVWSQKARPDVQTSIGRALKVVVQLSESMRRDTTPRLYGSNESSMRQPSVRAKASTVETAALPRSLRRCSYIWMERRVTPERRASPDWLSPARTRIVCSRGSPSVRLSGPLVVHVDESAFVGFVQSRVQSHDLVERQHIENFREPHSPGPLAVCEYPSGPVFGC